MSAIELAGLVKTFGTVRALDGFDLVVEPGEVHGFLGPNGSGKSTTMRVLLGLLRADAGTARMLGGDPWRDAAELHRRIAYVPGDVPLWPNLTGGEVIDVLGRLRGSGRDGLDEGLRARMLERFELDPTKRSRTYSKGNRQKVALVAAFSSEADLYLLDEPTSGLDPLMEAVFQECVEEVVSRGATVLLSSHILAEVERLADRVSIIRAGRNVQSGTLSDLRALTRTTVVAATREPVDLAGIEGVHEATHESAHGVHTVTLAVETAQLDDVVGVLHRAGIVSLQAHPPTLEELFLRQYGDVVAAEPEADEAEAAEAAAR